MRQQARSDGLKYGEGSIRQRGDSFEARWFELTSSGRRRRTRSFPTRDKAEDHLREMHRAHRDGKYESPSDLTVQEMIDDYLGRGAPEWSGYTLGQYRRNANANIYPMLGKIRADNLTTHQVQHWIDTMIKEKKAPRTIDSIVTILRSACNQAERMRIIDRNPVRGTKCPKIVEREPETWTSEEISKVMEAIDDPMFFTLYRIALCTGMRASELRTLRWSDIDFEEGTITVKRTGTRDENLRHIVGSTTKTKQSRPLWIDEPEVALLRSWRAAQNTIRLAASEPWDVGNYLFTRADGRPLADSTWQERHVKLCARAGVRYVTRHGMRHTNATHELAAGTNPKIVAARLGHRVETLLKTYSHVSPAVHRAAAADLRRRLFGEERA